MAPAPIDDILYAHASKGEIAELIKAAEEYEIKQYDVSLSPQFYQILAMAYLVSGDLVNARQVLKRATGTALKDPLTGKIGGVVHAVWNKHYKDAIAQTSALGFAPLDGVLRARLIVRVATTWAKAYEKPTVKDIATASGVDEATCAKLISECKDLALGADNVVEVVETPHASSWKESTMENITATAMMLRKPVA